MNIIVCVKQVPDTLEIGVDKKNNTLIREGVDSVINPFDLYAVEEALRLKERYGGMVTVLSMGPSQVVDTLRQALSLGAERGVLLCDIGFAGADTLATSYTLAMAAKKIGRFGIETLALGVKGVTDQSLEDRTMLTRVKELVLKEQGVKDIGRLRARQIGQKRWIDLEAKFDPQMKVCDVKEAIANVKKKIMGLFEDVADVVIISRVVEPELKEI